MKWRSHIAIAKALADRLGLDERSGKALSDGSIDPDRYPDSIIRVGRRGRVYASRAPHHNPSIRIVMRHVWNARMAYLKGDRVRAARSLGRALHYVQDKSLSKGFLGLSHGSREDEVALQKVPLEAIDDGISSAVCSPHYVEKVIREVKPQKGVREVMREACWASAAIAKAVLGMRDPPKELPSALRHAKERYWKRTIPLAATASMAFLLAAAITRNLLLALGVLSGYVIQLLDRKYHYLKKEAKWFGIS